MDEELHKRMPELRASAGVKIAEPGRFTSARFVVLAASTVVGPVLAYLVTAGRPQRPLAGLEEWRQARPVSRRPHRSSR